VARECSSSTATTGWSREYGADDAWLRSERGYGIQDAHDVVIAAKDRLRNGHHMMSSSPTMLPPITVIDCLGDVVEQRPSGRTCCGSATGERRCLNAHQASACRYAHASAPTSPSERSAHRYLSLNRRVKIEPDRAFYKQLRMGHFARDGKAQTPAKPNRAIDAFRTGRRRRKTPVSLPSSVCRPAKNLAKHSGEHTY
jgi:hypothetical protein